MHADICRLSTNRRRNNSILFATITNRFCSHRPKLDYLKTKYHNSQCSNERSIMLIIVQYLYDACSLQLIISKCQFLQFNFNIFICRPAFCKLSVTTSKLSKVMGIKSFICVLFRYLLNRYFNLRNQSDTDTVHMKCHKSQDFRLIKRLKFELGTVLRYSIHIHVLALLFTGM